MGNNANTDGQPKTDLVRGQSAGRAKSRTSKYNELKLLVQSLET